MLAYVCKYVPIEVFKALGEDIEILDPDVVNFNLADTLMHPNLCSFVKGTLEEFSRKNYEGIILTSCCDSVKRLYDVLKKNIQISLYICSTFQELLIILPMNYIKIVLLN